MLTQGTMVDTGMLNSSPDAAYVCCVVDGGEEKDGGGWIGLCAADCGTGRFLVGAWRDDDGASCLRTALAEIRPVEILTPPSGLAARVKMATDEMWRRANHRRSERRRRRRRFKTLRPRATSKRSRTASRTPSKSCATRRAIQCASADSAVGHCRRGTRAGAALVDADLVPQGRIESLHTTDAGARECLARWAHASHVAMDAAALSGLEVLENTTGAPLGRSWRRSIGARAGQVGVCFDDGSVDR